MKTVKGAGLLVVMSLFMGSGMVWAQAYNDPFSKHDTSAVEVPGVDADGDGCLSKSEIKAGSQLDKRFATRDHNGDGKLCKDEYFFPS